MTMRWQAHRWLPTTPTPTLRVIFHAVITPMSTTFEMPSAPPPAYRDRKRPAWLMSVFMPVTAALGPVLTLATGQWAWLWLPLALNYLGIALMDALLGEDLSNPPEHEVPRLEAERYYQWVTWATLPVLWATMLFCVWFVARHELPWHGWLAMVLVGGAVGGYAINLSHELGHKRSAGERWLAKLALAPYGYGHFTIEHNRGHHRDVATPADPASSRMGESIWRFALRELPGTARRAWVLERKRLEVDGFALWSWQNQILQPAAVTLLLWAALALWLGVGVLPYVLASSVWACFQLTSANYLETYGLLRPTDARSKTETCKPHHSWNSNHVFSNWVLFHLQRHSDHHAHPLRRYQSLRDFPDLPRLPSGYFGMFLLAYVPPLWFAVMNPRLLATVGHDASRINFCPRQREALMARYGLR
jgi:alkane 1-monooxygenase